MITQEVKGRLQLLETIRRSNAGDRDKTLVEFAKFNAKYSRLGATGEINLACREKDGLRFLLQKHSLVASFLPASAATRRAEPMRLALQGRSGTLFGRDYRGIEVLAAYAPVPGLHWGIVAKVDASEIEAPLLRTTVAALLLVMLLVFGGCLVITQLGKPLLRDLERSQQRVDLALRGISSGLWDWPNVNQDAQWWSPRLYELAGYKTDEMASSALSQLTTGICRRVVLWETAWNTEVSHAEEVHCPLVQRRTQYVAGGYQEAKRQRPESATGPDFVEG